MLTASPARTGHWPRLGLSARKLRAGRPESPKPRRHGRRGGPEAMQRKVHPNWQVLFVETGLRGVVGCCWEEFLKSCSKGFVAASSLFRWNRPWQRVVLVVPNLILAVYSIWTEGGSKINQDTKPKTRQPFKLHLFKAEHLVSPTYYPIRTWMNPGAIMPKNSPIGDINQFSGDFRFTHPHEQVHPITPQGPGLLGPCQTPGPLAFGAAGHRWGPQGEQNRGKAEGAWQQNHRHWCPGASELRESRKKPGREGDEVVSARLTWWRVLGVWVRLLGLG